MHQILLAAPLAVVLLTLCFALFVLTKAADILTDQAILFSKKIGISDLVIGATIVSLGTSLPEFATSVLALLQDANQLALGNALGSVITNLSFILGIGVLFGGIPVYKKSAYNVWFAFGGLTLLYVLILFNQQTMPRWLGIVFLILLPVYLYQSFKKTQKTSGSSELPQLSEEDEGASQSGPATDSAQTAPVSSMPLLVIKVVLAALVVALSSSVLVAAVQNLATRVGVSEGIISATIVALGTSLPELSTVIASVRKGHGGLAFGNLIGASLMNVFLVLGTTISFARTAIKVPTAFLQFHFPLALFLFVYLLVCLYRTKKKTLSKGEGVFFLLLYAVYLLYNVLQ